MKEVARKGNGAASDNDSSLDIASRLASDPTLTCVGVNGYQKLHQEGKRLVVFTGNSDGNYSESWCPDCSRTMPIVLSTALRYHLPLIVVGVGDRDDWKLDARGGSHPFRAKDGLALTGVPTLLFYGATGKELGRLGAELENEADPKAAKALTDGMALWTLNDRVPTKTGIMSRFPTLASDIIDGTLHMSGLPPTMLLSGACDGTDTIFGDCALEAGHSVAHFMSPEDVEWTSARAKALQSDWFYLIGNDLLGGAKVTLALEKAVEHRVLKTQRTADLKEKVAASIAKRNYVQVRRASAVYVVAWRIAEGMDALTGRNPVGTDETPKLDIGGGTGWAAQWYVDRFDDGGEDPAHCRLYLFDDGGPPWARRDEATLKKWNVWDIRTHSWKPIGGMPPRPSGLYAGIGSTLLSEEANARIRALYAQTQPGAFDAAALRAVIDAASEKCVRIFVSGAKSHVGKTMVCLGLLSSLRQAGFEASELGYIKPATQCEQPDLLAKWCEVEGVEHVSGEHAPLVFYSGFTRSFVEGQQGTSAQWIERIAAKIDELSLRRRVLIVDGVGFPSVGSICGVDNADVARAARAPVLLVCKSGVGEAIDSFSLNSSYFVAKGVPVLGVIFNLGDLEGYYSWDKCAKVIDRWFDMDVCRREKHYGVIPKIERLDGVRESFNKYDSAQLLGLAALSASHFAKHADVLGIFSDAVADKWNRQLPAKEHVGSRPVPAAALATAPRAAVAAAASKAGAGGG